MSIELGDKVRGIVTGFQGIAVGRTEWLNGCVRWMVQSDTLDKDGKPLDPFHFDAEQLKLIKAKTVAFTPSDRGGPIPTPQRRVVSRK